MPTAPPQSSLRASTDVPISEQAPSSISTSTSDKENPGGFLHIPALDGIRGTAILLVLLDHLFWSNDHTGYALVDLFAHIRTSAYVGVNLFFALSGFLITGILLETRGNPHFFRNFYARRSLRIFPIYYGSLLALLLLTRPLHFTWSGWQYFYLTYTSNLVLWGRYRPLSLGSFNINHFWSLQVEEQFYLLWPLILYRVRSLQSLIRISLIGCGVILCIRIFLVAMRYHPAFASIYLPYSPTFSCADNILFGCCLCIALRTPLRAEVLRLAPRVFAISVAVLLIVAIPNRGLEWGYEIASPARLFLPTVGFSLFGISAASLIAMTLIPGSKTQRLFANPFLRFFGKYSYGIYVFHPSIDGLIRGPIRAFLNSHLHSRSISVAAGALATGTATVLLAMLSYHLFEIQFLHAKRYFSYNRPAAAKPQHSSL